MAGNELAAAQARLAELELEWNALSSRFNDGSASPEDHEWRLELFRAVLSARAVLAAHQRQVMRAASAQAEAEFFARRDQVMNEISELIPRLQLALAGFRQLTTEAHNISFSPDRIPTNAVADLFNGLPSDFGERLSRAIVDAAPHHTWSYALPGVRFELPTKREDRRVLQLGCAEPPPGVGKVINVRGEPVET